MPDLIIKVHNVALHQSLGQGFTPTVAAAWSTAYAPLADVTKREAAELDKVVTRAEELISHA